MTQSSAAQPSKPDPSQFNTDRTYPGRWTIVFSKCLKRYVASTATSPKQKAKK